MKLRMLLYASLCLTGTMTGRIMLYAQSSEADSLRMLLRNVAVDSTKADIYNKLSFSVLALDAGLCGKYADSAMRLSGRTGYDNGLGSGYINKGLSFSALGNKDQALECYEKALEIFNKTGNLEGLAQAYNDIGLIYDDLGEYPSALKHYLKALTYFEKLALEPAGGARSAIKAGMAILRNNIGLIHWYSSDYKAATSAFAAARDEFKALNHLNGLASASSNLGGVYFNQDSIEKALPFFEEALGYYLQTGNRRGEGNMYTNIGMAYTEMQQFDHALEYQLKALSIAEALDDSWSLVYAMLGAGDLYSLKGDYVKGEAVLLKALETARELGAGKEVESAYTYLKEMQLKHGDFNNAIIWYKKQTALRDSLFNEDKSKEIGRLEAKHDNELAELKRLHTRRETERMLFEKKRRRVNLQYSGIVIVLVMLLIAAMAFSGTPGLVRRIPPYLAEGAVFLTFLLFFEFMLVLLDPYIDRFSSGAPVIKLAFNALLAALIFPVHAAMEKTINKRMG